jgi:CheY-like chemotaxis protein
MAQVLALVDDLIFQAKMQETARLVGVDLRACSTGEALLAAVAKDAPKLVIVDLNARNNTLSAIERIRASAHDIPLVAFLSHVQVELAERARAAGCREVMPRSQFARDLATILAQAKSQS